MTTKWTAEMQAEIDRWLEAQRTWWEHLLDAAAKPDLGAGQGQPQPSPVAGRQAIEVWRAAACRVVDAQAQAMLGTLTEGGQSDVEALLRQWTDTQREMWQGWLAMAEGEGPKSDSETLEAAGQQLVEGLREAAEHLVHSQAEWAKAWTDATTDGREATHEGSQGGP